MRKLAILLLVASPILTVIGMAGCVESIASIGNSSRQMTPLEVFGLLGAPLLFVAGVVLLTVDWRRRRRRRRAEGPRADMGSGTPHALTRVASVTVSVGRIVTRSALAAVAFGVVGVALNALFLVMTTDAWLTVIESGATVRYVVIALACVIACLPVGYVVLAWRVSFRKRIGEALRAHEDAIMKAMESAAIDYVKSRSVDSSHTAVLAACIRRIASLPEPVKQILTRVARRTELSTALDLAMGTTSGSEPDYQAGVSLAMAGIRRRLDEALFAPRRHRLLYLLLFNLCLFGLMMGLTGGLAEFTGAVIGGVFLVGVILLSNHPVAKDMRGMLKGSVRLVVSAVGIVALSVTGLALISKKRSQSVRWVGFAFLEILYALLLCFTGFVFCEQYKGEQTHIIIPVTVVAFLIPSAFLMWWIKATRIFTSPLSTKQQREEPPTTGGTVRR